MHIATADNTIVASYTYDAWGNIESVTGTLANTVGTINPIRYRGYYYDNETELYYLNARYYDSEIGRWISPEPNVYTGAFDSGAGIFAYNIYAYCANNPVKYSDYTGEFILTSLIVGAVVGAAIGFGATVYSDYKDDGEIFNGSVDVVDYVANTVVGGIVGGATGGTGSSSVALTIPTINVLTTTAQTTAIIVDTTVVTVTVNTFVEMAATAIGLTFFANRSGKEKSTDKPSWVNKNMVDPKKSPQRNATDILNNKYGEGKWSMGPGSEFNKIVKWIQRKVFFYGG